VIGNNIKKTTLHLDLVDVIKQFLCPPMPFLYRKISKQISSTGEQTLDVKSLMRMT